MYRHIPYTNFLAKLGSNVSDNDCMKWYANYKSIELLSDTYPSPEKQMQKYHSD